MKDSSIKSTSPTVGDSKGRRVFIAAFLGTFLAAPFAIGCRSLNENPKNTRVWFPTLAPPTREEQSLREENFPEGGDPFVDAETGPRSLNARPKGWDIQRSKTYYDQN